MSKKLVLIDGHSILNRAFFGLPDLTNAEGVHTNAVYGFLNIMFRILEEEKPDYLTVAFDLSAPTFRHKMFDGYKGTRKPMAPELKEQVPLMKEMLRAMGICIVEKEGFEADDVLGTLSCRGEQEGMEVSVISGDRDLLQLATEHVQIRIPKTKKTGTEIENYYAKDVKERYLVTPKEFIDVKALMGDTSDNIPGVPGIGEKTATALIAQYGSIEAVHEHADEVKPPRASKNIVEFWDQAVMSKTLATIITDADVEYSFDQAELSDLQELYTEDAYVLCKRLEFKNLLGRFQLDSPAIHVEEQFQIVKDQKQAEKIWEKTSGKSMAFHLIPADSGKKKEKLQTEPGGQLSLFETGKKEVLSGMTLAFGEEDIYLFLTGQGITSEFLIDAWQNAKVSRRISSDLKAELQYCQSAGPIGTEEEWNHYLDMRKEYMDTGIAAYLLNPLKGEYPYEDIASEYLGMMLPSKAELFGKKSFEQVLEEDENTAAKPLCYEVYTAWKASEILEKELKDQGMWELYQNIEMPLVFVLSDMEKQGISIDAQALKEYGSRLAESISVLEHQIYEKAGEQFNINSPKQLGVILFEKLQLPNAKKTKTGYSTSAEVLEKLAPEYPIVSDILSYRQLTKLKSTYADGLANCISDDGKIHTTFNQTITATGRLSSTEPNLQNIPIRIELGKEIRRVFHPEKEFLFVDSDYSQIELRVLASMSGDRQLIDAYRQHSDIHRITASQVFHVPFDEVTPLQRRNAKAVNFGIVYGISSFGLSQDLSISRKEASEYIDRYFATYPKIKEFLDQTVKDAKEKGYTTTLFGRRRPVPELSSSNFMQRSFGERVAMNSPIQGTAADIIKIAMIRVHDRLMKENCRSRLLLQVHDELLVETYKEEKEQVEKILAEEMQQAADLAVCLEIDTESGENWYEAH